MFIVSEAHFILFARGSFVMPMDIEKHTFLLKVIFSFSFFCSSGKGVSVAGGQTMGHRTGPTIMCFNPGSRLKEQSQDAALNH